MHITPAEIYNAPRELNEFERRLKNYAKIIDNNKHSFIDYYKKSLILADGDFETLKNDKNNKLEQVKNVENEKLKKIIKNKIIKSRNLYSEMRDFDKIINDSYIITANKNSKLYEQIINSDTIKEFIKKHYKDIKNGKLKEKATSVVFEHPNRNDKKDKTFWDKLSLYLILHRADLHNVHINDNGDLIIDIIDDYNFDYWETTGRPFLDAIIKINNAAYHLQQAGELIPYILRIPIVIPKEEFEEMCSDFQYQETLKFIQEMQSNSDFNNVLLP